MARKQRTACIPVPVAPPAAMNLIYGFELAAAIEPKNAVANVHPNAFLELSCINLHLLKLASGPFLQFPEELRYLT